MICDCGRDTGYSKNKNSKRKQGSATQGHVMDSHTISNLWLGDLQPGRPKSQRWGLVLEITAGGEQLTEAHINFCIGRVSTFLKGTLSHVVERRLSGKCFRKAV
jgi:hypothetical protein